MPRTCPAVRSYPYIVLEDADLDYATETCVNSRLINAGQSCIPAKRFIVVQPALEAFTARFVALMQTQRSRGTNPAHTGSGSSARSPSH